MSTYVSGKLQARQHALPTPGRECGFTSIELVLAIVILAILGAVAAPRFFDNHAFSERGYFDEVTAALRYAQKVAVASGCRVRVALGPDSYVLTQQVPLAGHCDASDLSFPVSVRLPDGQPMSGTAPSGVSLAPPLTLVYDALGRTDLGVDLPLSIGPWSMLIEAESGLVVTP